MSPRKAAKKAAYEAAKEHGDVVTEVWVDEVPFAVDHKKVEEVEGVVARNEARIESAVVAAMDRAARAGLGNRGRLRAGQRAMSKEQGRIAKERGR